MKTKIIELSAIALISVCFAATATAQSGKPFIHDPSTIMECDGKYYTFGTGGGGLISEDGWIWNSGAVRPGGGAAPDAMKIGDRYLIVYGATGGGLGGGHNGRILTMWNKTLDPQSPDFQYSEPILVAQSDGIEDNDAIDPGLLLDPNDGRLWCSYGTYFGFIRLIELDPQTGKRVEGNKAIDIAIDCEATDLEYRDGWYYLLGTHGTCCDGANSTYNIVVGRSRSVTGPYLDNMGRDMLRGGGKMVLSAGGRLIGPGHFGRLILEEGVEKMSCHYEADLDQSGRSVLGIRPLLWKDGWPVAGDIFREGTYEIESVRRGYALELTVDFIRMPGRMRGFRPDPDEPIISIPSQELADVIHTWPAGEIDVRIGDYMSRPHQQWTITAVPDAGGYLGGPYYRIVIAGTNRALAATADAEVITVPEFTGAPEQLWRIDQLTDGTYRIMPKVVPGSDENLVLVSVGDSTPSLGRFDMNSDNSKWNFRSH
ncbi:MAG TPA: family 43 glycosylhydrolase [Bacteroidales bacterium]|nr:family 43 glycosylhydrolase [Bacteroidales bacterium]MDI9534246.1 family 43 glycosylhydrolase [Bacteroidota bacterium]MZQ80220.1 family 43 glycosylhydrolase [Bacteroidales bacterium]HHU99638.1 family 43 glycosylhydrolase [Bacteroidales bacterium]HNV66159.1 family 43 glycosylhydrolase [Bacteroidales bacterium]